MKENSESHTLLQKGYCILILIFYKGRKFFIFAFILEEKSTMGKLLASSQGKGE